MTPKYLKFSFKKKINNKRFSRQLEKNIGFPLVIKPLNEGSSVNVFICTKSNFYKNLFKLKEYDQILIERYIHGREIQVAILNEKILGAIELRPKENFMIMKQSITQKQKRALNSSRFNQKTIQKNYRNCT